jgi:hypothetical protein
VCEDFALNVSLDEYVVLNYTGNAGHGEDKSNNREIKAHITSSI